MKRISALALAVAAVGTTVSTRATVLDVTFQGVVTAEQNAGSAVNSTVTGQFLYDTSSGSFSSFTIDGQSVASGFASSAAISPDDSAIYEAQVSPVSTGGNLNSTFVLDLESINGWPQESAVALLQDGNQLATNLDIPALDPGGPNGENFTYSNFSYYMANANGTNVQSLSANLESIEVAAVPEPATCALMIAGLLGVAYLRRRVNGGRHPDLKSRLG